MARRRAEGAARAWPYSSYFGSSLSTDRSVGAGSGSACIYVLKHDSCPHSGLAVRAWGAAMRQVREKAFEERIVALSSG